VEMVRVGCSNCDDQDCDGESRSNLCAHQFFVSQRSLI
jgi:hypothetical protein